MTTTDNPTGDPMTTDPTPAPSPAGTGGQPDGPQREALANAAWQQEVWTSRLAGLFAKNRTGGQVFMGGEHLPRPSEERSARAFVNDLLAAVTPRPTTDNPSRDEGEPTYSWRFSSGMEARPPTPPPPAGTEALPPIAGLIGALIEPDNHHNALVCPYCRPGLEEELARLAATQPGFAPRCPVCGLHVERQESGEIICTPTRCPAWTYIGHPDEARATASAEVPCDCPAYLGECIHDEPGSAPTDGEAP